MAINIEGKNILHDIYRLLWYLTPIVLAFIFGYLYHEHRTNQIHLCTNNSYYYVTCPLELPKTGI